MKLTIELVPSTCWYSNVRSNVSEDEWDKIRRKSYKKANWRCEICGDVGTNQGVNHSVECHEIWEYDEHEKSQTLTGLISLCPNCHKVKHTGLAIIKGERDLVVKWLMAVNDISKRKANKLIEKAFDVWRERSEYEWKLDISYLDEYMKPEPPSKNYWENY